MQYTYIYIDTKAGIPNHAFRSLKHEMMGLPWKSDSHEEDQNPFSSTKSHSIPAPLNGPILRLFSRAMIGLEIQVGFI